MSQETETPLPNSTPPVADPARARTRAIVGASALALAVPGLVLLFASAEVSPVFFGIALPESATALVAAAWLALASMNWLARHSILGGIYGRPVVAANQVHFTIGALVLVRTVLRSGGSSALWALTGVYVAFALYFNALLYGPGLTRRDR